MIPISYLLFALISVIITFYLVYEFQNNYKSDFISDKDIIEYLKKDGEGYLLKDLNSCGEYLKHKDRNKPLIFKQKYSLLFPYYINNIGIIPFWYGSKDIIDELWNRFPSYYSVKKKEILGI